MEHNAGIIGVYMPQCAGTYMACINKMSGVVSPCGAGESDSSLRGHFDESRGALFAIRPESAPALRPSRQQQVKSLNQAPL